MAADFARAMPLHGLEGGMLIGLAAALMLLGNGRIAGVSGLAARAAGLAPAGAPWPVALAFVAGLPLGGLAVAWLGGGVTVRFTAPVAVLILAGLACGYGTRLGTGCTSGHGVCGLARLSPRSLAATAVFMAAGILTVALMRFLGLGA